MVDILNNDEKVFLLNKYINSGCSESEAVKRLGRTMRLIIPVVGMVV